MRPAPRGDRRRRSRGRPPGGAARSWLRRRSLVLLLLATGLRPLPGHEVLYLALRGIVELAEIGEELDVSGRHGLCGDTLEELAHADAKLRQDPEQCVEAHPVLALLHAGEIGLLDAD